MSTLIFEKNRPKVQLYGSLTISWTGNDIFVSKVLPVRRPVNGDTAVIRQWDILYTELRRK